MTEQLISQSDHKTTKNSENGGDGVWRLQRPGAGAVGSIGVIALAGFFIPLVVQERHYLTLAVDMAILAILATGVGFLARQCGLISFGHAAFYGGSAYLVAVLLDKTSISPTLAVLLAVVGSTALAAVIGSLIVRVSGISFGILTLAFGQLIYVVVLQNRSVTGGNDGVPLRFDGTVAGLDQGWFEDGAMIWTMVWTVLIVLLICLWVFSRSRFGRLLVAIRENEERARFSGFSTYWPRVVAFTISGFIAGVAGVLMVLSNSFVSPEQLSWHTSGNALIVAILGGVAAITGPALGAFIFLFGQDMLSALTERFYIVVGLAVIGVVVFAPGGIAGIARSIAERAWLRHRSKEQA